MSPTRPQMSIALPPASALYYTDGHTPKTPKMSEEDSLVPPCSGPPPPPRQTYKIKRKRVVTQPTYIDEEQIIPTIEMSLDNSSPDISSPMLSLNTSPTTNGLLAPSPQLLRSLTPPKTPAARMLTSFDTMESPAREWSMITDGNNGIRPFERTGSIGSSFSDSSLSSLGSLAFSTTTPDTELIDPFAGDDVHGSSKAFLATLASSPNAKRAKTLRRAMWTPAMDEHLWLTYMAYLSDPTLTPFKMLPGTSPPLGVCHRVASKARRTWRDHRTSNLSMESVLSAAREGSPDTIRPESSKMAQHQRLLQWPRSESETRKRLRTLCKKRPSLSAHYQRLLRTRSPSPFQSSSSSSAAVTRSSEPPSTFSGVDMKISLITSTSSSMQPDGPLAQLTTADTPIPRPHSSQQRTTRPVDWFSRIGRSQAHQKSLSLQSGLGLDTKSINTFTTTSNTTLASPFDEATSRSHLLNSSAATKSLGRDFNRSAPLLASPFEGAPTAPRSLKRRFRSDEEKPKRLPLQGIFGHSEPFTATRSRGFSLGATESLDVFSPPTQKHIGLSQPYTPLTSEQDHNMLDTPETSMLGPAGSRSAPRRLAEPTPRLGSPFVESTASSRQFNTFPRTYLPSTDNPQPFQRRLQELVSQNPQSDL